MERLCFHRCLSVHWGEVYTPQADTLPPDRYFSPGQTLPQQTTTAADSTHPTGMHSCFQFKFTLKLPFCSCWTHINNGRLSWQSDRSRTEKKHNKHDAPNSSLIIRQSDIRRDVPDHQSGAIDGITGTTPRRKSFHEVQKHKLHKTRVRKHFLTTEVNIININNQILVEKYHSMTYNFTGLSTCISQTTLWIVTSPCAGWKIQILGQVFK